MNIIEFPVHIYTHQFIVAFVSKRVMLILIKNAVSIILKDSLPLKVVLRCFLIIV